MDMWWGNTPYILEIDGTKTAHTTGPDGIITFDIPAYSKMAPLEYHVREVDEFDENPGTHVERGDPQQRRRFGRGRRCEFAITGL